MSAPTRAPDPNLALAKAMGSKRGYDPMPPDQHEWQRAEGEPPLYRFWSWMCGHTIRLGRRSPFAVDEKGKPRALKDAAADLDMDLGQLSNVWKQGEQAGLWHRKGRELYLNGGVTAASVLAARGKRQLACTLNLSEAELLKIKDWPPEKQKAFHAIWDPSQDYRAKLEAQKIAEARAACDDIEDNIRREFQLEKKRLPKRRPEGVELPQALLPFVHSTSVQINGHERTVGENDGENASVPAVPSLLGSEKEQRGSPAAAVALKEEQAALATALATDAAAAETLLLECRNAEPTVTVPEIVGLAIQKLGTPEKRAKLTNPIGLLIKTLPALCRGEPLARVRREIAFAREQMDREVRRKARDAEEDLRRCRDILEHPEGWDDQSIQLAREALERAENRQAKTAGGET
jgi:hypothetical protein